ncbi:hypothetical protein MT418_002461 [Batrachochytrium dendrobatidis]
MDAVAEYGMQSLSFLKELDPKSLLSTYQKERLENPWSKKSIRAADNAQEDQFSISDNISDASDVEASYERAPRSTSNGDSEAVSRLPIKTKTGEIVQLQSIPAQKVDQSDIYLSEVSDDESDVSEPESKPVSKPKTNKKQSASKTPSLTFLEAREQLAQIASRIIEDPENNIGELKTLQHLSKSSDARSVKFALLTQLAVFKDIIPGYRIRKLTDKELSASVSQEVKRVRRYEESLIGKYQEYLQLLESLVTDISDDDENSIPGIALKCLSDLLKSVPHFNFRLNIMTVVINSLRKVKAFDLIHTCCNSIGELLREDVTGEASLEAVKLISKLAKQSHYQVRSCVIKTFLSLRLLDELHVDRDDGIRKSHPSKKRKQDGQVPYMSKKMRKINRAQADVDVELQEAEATIDRSERQKLHSETLKFVFLVYFRILKEAPESPLVVPALEGLGKFSHLINIDIFNDLVAAIKKICLHHLEHTDNNIKSSQRLSISLQCILTVLQLLSSIKDAIKTDMIQFHTATYAILSKLALDNPLKNYASSNSNSDRSKISLMLLVLELMLQKTHNMPANRVASFLKRLSTTALHLTDNATIGSLATIHKTLMRLPQLHSLIDGEEAVGSGVYNPYMDDMDLCNPFATNLWEMSIMANNHYHPSVRTAAIMVLQHSDSSKSKALPSDMHSLARNRPLKIMEEYDLFRGNSFAIRPPCKRPGRQLNIPVFVSGPSVMRISAFLENLELCLE